MNECANVCMYTKECWRMYEITIQVSQSLCCFKPIFDSVCLWKSFVANTTQHSVLRLKGKKDSLDTDPVTIDGELVDWPRSFKVAACDVKAYCIPAPRVACAVLLTIA